MEFTALWWYWLIFGMILVVAEMLVPSFTMFWFGLAAFLVALLLYIAPESSLSLQIICWALGSIGFTFLWFKFFKPTMTDRTKAGISRRRSPEKQASSSGLRRMRSAELLDLRYRFLALMNGSLSAMTAVQSETG